MPPRKAKQPTPAEVAVLRAWVAAGAKDDGVVARVTLPDIKPKTRTGTPANPNPWSPPNAHATQTRTSFPPRISRLSAPR